MTAQTHCVRRRVSRIVALAIIGSATLANGAAFAAPPPSASAPISAASKPIDPAVVEAAIARLGSADAGEREYAERTLREFGDRAAPALFAHVTDPDPQIARHCLAMLPMPRDPTERARAACRLLETGRGDAGERAVNFIFEGATDVLKPFQAALAASNMPVDSPQRRAADFMLGELDLWVAHFELMQKRLPNMKPEDRARHEKLMAETRASRMEASRLMVVAEFGEAAAPPAELKRRPPVQP